MIDLVTNRKDYYVQANNELDKNISCQCTTIVAGLDVMKYNIDILINLYSFKQPEDNLRYYTTHNVEVLSFCNKSHPNSSIHPSEWADVLIFSVNKIYQTKAAYFESNLTPEKILEDLYNRKPVMASMKYSNVAGHYVLVVGEDKNNFIINDPYKNFLKNTSDGFHCIYTPADWNKHSKGYGIRYC
jgi:hypothetical protein